ncbi:MAG: hypothetical protein KC589_11055 [Nanoarchaeota archaeon]|nr:hypothetical protein [Nanoarchaeota archaeon]
MDEKIVNPFTQNKKVDWAKKAQNRLSESKNDETGKKEDINKKIADKKNQNLDLNIEKNSKKSNTVERVAKSFKIYPGKISRDFDKRVNKLQVYFDDLDYDKNYVDSGKYMMFLMSFAEKFDLYELYKEVDLDGELNLSLEEVKEFLKNKK